jgi:protein-S-isoprenylcysteine O-methyltransferase Ste14
MHSLARFWVVVLSLLVGLVAFGFLMGSFLFPEIALFTVDSTTRLLVVLVGAAAIGVVVWSSTAAGTVTGDQPPERN